MTRNTRLALVAAVVVIAVVAFVVAKPGDDGDTTADRSSAPARTTETPIETTNDGRTETQPTARQPEPAVTRIAIKGQKRQGPVKTITVQKGDRVRILVTSDAPNLIHLHGFDMELEAAPAKPARFGFKADLEGEFELESHTFEDAGLDAALAKLRVEPD